LVLKKMAGRDSLAERMDDPILDPVLHREALRGLERINAWSRVVEAVWGPLRVLAREARRGEPLRVLDIATGGGDFPIRLRRKSLEEKIPLGVEGSDRSETALEYARQRSRKKNLDLHFFRLDVLEDPLPDSYDVFTANLFLHHLRPEEILELMRRFKASQAKLVIASDLERSFAGLGLAYLGSRFLTRSPIVHFDAVQSVRNAYRIEEVRVLAEETGLKGAVIRRVWPFRYVFIWRRDGF